MGDKQALIQMGNLLRQARLGVRKTQAQIARMSKLDVRYYNRVERGRANVTFTTLSKITDALHLCPVTIAFISNQTLPEVTLDIVSRVEHINAKQDRKRLLQLRDFLAQILGVECTCTRAHCPGLKLLRERKAVRN
ncbi:MAG: helix-turn-helix transcriptional regulator [Nitrospirae bacterium]|nr:helix-turn-helix transcriptional regulator [Nitrospirota bacterium]